MDKIFEILSTREIALLFWAVVILVLFIAHQQIRESVFDVVKIIFGTPVLLITNLLVLDYTLLMIDFLQRIQFWDESLIKDTIIWLLGTGVVLTYSSFRARQISDFKKVLFDLAKWTIFLEFVVNFFTFNLLIEIFLLPVLVFIVLVQETSDLNPKHRKVESIFKSINAIVGFSITFYALYWMFSQPETLFNVITLKSFLLPIILTILFLPLVYLFKLYAEYETLFKRLKFLIHDEKHRKETKIQILIIANLNLKSLLNISSKIAKLILVDESKSLEDIRKISR